MTNVRTIQKKDVREVLLLMKSLAKFEGYLDRFVVAEQDLIDRCIKHQEFQVLVAEKDGVVIGILVFYFIPFTYDLSPWIFIKELFVDSKFRGTGAGEALMKLAARKCKEAGGNKMRWDVLHDNFPAQNFYKNLGATQNSDWVGFQLNSDGIDVLSSPIKEFPLK